jgi:hypothetical protein
MSITEQPHVADMNGDPASSGRDPPGMGGGGHGRSRRTSILVRTVAWTTSAHRPWVSCLAGRGRGSEHPFRAPYAASMNDRPCQCGDKVNPLPASHQPVCRKRSSAKGVASGTVILLEGEDGGSPRKRPNPRLSIDPSVRRRQVPPERQPTCGPIWLCPEQPPFGSLSRCRRRQGAHPRPASRFAPGRSRACGRAHRPGCSDAIETTLLDGSASRSPWSRWCPRRPPSRVRT